MMGYRTLRSTCLLVVSLGTLAACIGDTPAAVNDAGARDVERPDTGVDAGPALASFAVTTTATKVAEHELFTITVTAKHGDGTTYAEYAGAPTVTSTWGDARIAGTAAFANGQTTLSVALNRETNPSDGPAKIQVRDGAAVGFSTPVEVTLPDWGAGKDVLFPAGAQWDPSFNLPNSSLVRLANGNLFVYYSAQTPQPNNKVRFQIGAATSTNGILFTKAPKNPILSSGTLPWDNDSANLADVVIDGGTFVMLYQGSNADHTTAGYGIATATDGLTFTRRNAQLSFGQGLCSSITTPRLVVEGPGKLRVMYSSNGGICTSTSNDQGVTWTSAGPITGVNLNGAAPSQVIKEGSVYKTYFAFVDVFYATSSDGTNWVMSPRGALKQPFPLALAYNGQAFTLEGLTPGNGGALAFYTRP